MFVQSSQDGFEIQSTVIEVFISVPGRVYADPVKKEKKTLPSQQPTNQLQKNPNQTINKFPVFCSL